MIKKSALLPIFILTLLAGVLGYNYFVHPFAGKTVGSEAQKETIGDNQAEPQDLSSTQALIQTLSDSQKISQLLAFPLVVDEDKTASYAAALQMIEEEQPGVVTLFGTRVSSQSARSTISSIDRNYDQVHLRPLIAVDHEGGSAQRLNGTGFTQLPSWRAMCVQDEDQLKLELLQSARELKSVGVNVVLSPVIDLAISHPVLKDRVCSDDPALVAERAGDYIKIFQAEDILPVIKHFPGIGQTTVDLHRAFESVDLREEDLRVYDQLLTQFPTIGTMITHVGIKNSFQNLPCSLSEDCISGFTDVFSQGLIFSDALDMKSALLGAGGSPSASGSAKVEASLSQIAKQAILAGNNVLIFGPQTSGEDFQKVVADLTSAYQQDPEFSFKVEESLTKLIDYKLSLQ